MLRSGFIIEPSSATVLSGYWKLMGNNKIDKNDEVVLILTGNGLNYVDLINKNM